MKVAGIYTVIMSVLTAVIITAFACTDAFAEDNPPEIFPGVYLTAVEFNPDDMALVYELWDQNVSVMGWEQEHRDMYMFDLTLGIAPAVFLHEKQVKRLLAGVTLVFVSYDKDGMWIGYTKLDKELYLRWYYFNNM